MVSIGGKRVLGLGCIGNYEKTDVRQVVDVRIAVLFQWLFVLICNVVYLPNYFKDEEKRNVNINFQL